MCLFVIQFDGPRSKTSSNVSLTPRRRFSVSSFFLSLVDKSSSTFIKVEQRMHGDAGKSTGAAPLWDLIGDNSDDSHV